MSEEKLIYSKRFHNPTAQELEEEMKKDKNLENYKPRFETGNDFIENFINKTEYVPIPARIENKQLFINAVIELSQTYEIDADIYEAEGHIAAKLIFMPCSFMGGVKEMLMDVLDMADDISFFTSNKNPDAIELIAFYNTHDLYVEGRKINRI